MANHNNQLAVQLQALASALPTIEDKELLPIILDTCSGLMAEVGIRRPEATQMDPTDLVGYQAGYTAISALVGQFAKELSSAVSTDAPEGSVEDAMAKLEDLRAEAARQEAELTRLEGLIQDQQAKNDILEAAIKKHQADLRRQTDFHETLMEMDRASSPEIIANQQKENSELLATVNEHNTQLKSLQDEKSKLDTELNSLRGRISNLQNAIDVLPEAKKQLVRDYDAKYAELIRLQNAETECSAEKQEELAAKIVLLEPQVEQLAAQTEKLRDHYNQIANAKTELDRDNQVLQTDLLKLLQASMGELAQLMEENRQALINIRKQADKFYTSLDECNRLRIGYEQWLGSNRAQLDANLEALDHQENTRLKETLNVSCHEQLNKQCDQAKQALEEADRILQRCAAAAQVDLHNVERLAGGR